MIRGREGREDIRDRVDAHGRDRPGADPVHAGDDANWARQWWGLAVIAATTVFVVAVVVGLVVAG